MYNHAKVLLPCILPSKPLHLPYHTIMLCNNSPSTHLLLLFKFIKSPCKNDRFDILGFAQFFIENILEKFVFRVLIIFTTNAMIYCGENVNIYIKLGKPRNLKKHNLSPLLGHTVHYFHLIK